MIGGIGLVACGVLTMLRTSLPGGFGPFSVWNMMVILAGVSYSAAVLLFAIGTSRQASVVARRPLGVISMAIVAAWPLVDVIAAPFLPRDESSVGVLMTYGYVTLIVQTGAALIAASQIARAGVLSAPWCWAPMWVLGLQAFAWAVPQIVVVSKYFRRLAERTGYCLPPRIFQVRNLVDSRAADNAKYSSGHGSGTPELPGLLAQKPRCKSKRARALRQRARFTWVARCRGHDNFVFSVWYFAT